MKENQIFAITGADPSNGNCGLGALAFGALEAIYAAYPNAKVVLIDYYIKQDPLKYEYNGSKKHIERIGLRFTWKPHLRNNIIYLLFAALLIRIFHSKYLKKSLYTIFPYLKRIKEIDTAYSISGGDSFSDIYGLPRYFYVILPQLIYLLLGVPLIQLPQTFGPYKNIFCRLISKFILYNSNKIYARDHDSLLLAKTLINKKADKANFCFDVGFLLKPKKPSNFETSFLKNRTTDVPLIGININGLLLKGGYYGKNQFGLLVDYGKICRSLIELFIIKLKCQVILIPHVLDDSCESDTYACKSIYEQLNELPNLFFESYPLETQEIKYLIGHCDFFIGSRMHACIGALSQNIPTVPLAYSRKFIGIMKSINLENCVVNLYETALDDIHNKVYNIFVNRKTISTHLKRAMPFIRMKIKSTFSINI